MIFQDKCDQGREKLTELSLILAEKNHCPGKRNSFYEELESFEDTVDEPKKVEPKSFADIMKLAKASKKDESKEIKSVPVVHVKKVMSTPADRVETRDANLKESAVKAKYDVRAIQHKARQIQDSCSRDRERISAVLKIHGAERDRLNQVGAQVTLM